MMNRNSLNIASLASRVAALLFPLAAALALAGCGGSGDDGARSSEPGQAAGYRVGITVTGLPSGEQIQVDLSDLTPPVAGSSGAQVNQSMTVSNGSTVFPTAVPDGTVFAVRANMAGEAVTLRCDTRNADLRTIRGADITGIEIDCNNGHLLGGMIEGLEGSGLSLRVNIDEGAVAFQEFNFANGRYAFLRPASDGEAYPIEVATQPSNPDQQCIVSNGRGVVSGADVSNINVACGEATIGYIVNGLSGSGLIVSLAVEVENSNGTTSMLVVEKDDVTGNGEFTFDTFVRRDAPYHVAVYRQPSDPAQECSVPNGRGIIVADTTVVEVRCPLPLRMYRFDNAATRNTDTPLSGGAKLGGVLDESFVFGPGPAVKLGNVSGLNTTELFQVRLDNDTADGIVFSNVTGETYWLAAETRGNFFVPDPLYGYNGYLSQTQLATLWRFRKVTAAAKFRLELSQVNLLAYFDTAISPTNPNQIKAAAFLQVAAHRAAGVDFELEPFYSAASDITLIGRVVENQTAGASISWNLESQVLATTDFPIWSKDDFLFNPRAGVNFSEPNSEHVATAQLAASKFIEVDVSGISVGEEFGIVSSAVVYASNFLSAEGGSVVYLRDPAAFDPGVDQGGVKIETEGLVLVDAGDIDLNSVRFTPSTPAPACDAPGGAQSVLEFSAAQYRVSEGDLLLDAVKVTRNGSASGLVSAQARLTGGTATVGVDFATRDLMVRFGNGSTDPRTMAIPILADTLVEGDETLTLTLESPGGCAVIGARNTATVTIVDDDAPPPSSSFYTVSGTVSGLVGSGLQLSNIGSSNLAVTANGPFSFPRETPNGISYAVQVASQPTNPGQSCVVTNGSGRIANADVSNVEVACTTLPVGPMGLDPGFATGGKLSVGSLGSARDVVVQADGKILVLTKTTLARFQANGAMDTGFGSGGMVTPNFFAGQDALEAIAVQPDGRIVIAGATQNGVNSPTRQDFALARLDATGAFDQSFGTAGKVVTDLYGSGDTATDVLIQPDGAIVVTGSATIVNTLGFVDSNFAAVRYTSSGAIDTSFGSGGKVNTNIAGRTDIAYAAALQFDGSIVIAGRVANTGGENPDIGLVRYTSAGMPDPNFGTNGVVRVSTPDWDEAADVVIQPDGRIVVAGFHLGPTFNEPDQFTVMRFDSSGNADASFGNAGRVDTPALVRGRALALQTDGKIVVVGQRIAGQTAPDFGIVRFDAIGGLDGSFGTGGVLAIDFFGGNDEANAVAIQPDGKMVAAGAALNGTQSTMGLTRVLP